MKRYQLTHPLVCAAFAFSAALPCLATEVPSMPSDEALRKEAINQLKQANAAMDKAAAQARIARPQAPAIEPPVSTGKVVDPAAIAKRYDGLSKPNPSALYVMVSLSIPQDALISIADMSARAGAIMVIRGVVDNSLQKTITKVAQLTAKHPNVQLQIDPTVFKRFDIQQVPTYVLAKQMDSQAACTKSCDPSDQYMSVSGDVSLDYALEYFAKQGNPEFAALANKYLALSRPAQ